MENRSVIMFNNATNETEWDKVNKADVGLDKVDNTADIEKPVSVAQQAAINAAIPVTPLLGAAEPVHSKRLKVFLIVSAFIILSAFLVKALNIHIVKTRNTFRITSDRVWKGEVKHRTK